MKVLILGANGMAGHLIAYYLIENKLDVFCGTRRPSEMKNNIIIDYEDRHGFIDIITKGKYDYIINCIGILNKAAEANKSQALFINSYLPHLIAETIKNTDTRLIHLSTDCVFSGNKGNYNENDFSDGETFYDRTKALGEILDNKNLTFRNSIIGPDINNNGIGLFNWFMNQKDCVNGYIKSIWSGVSTITLAKAILKAIECKLTGLYHLVNNQNINKFELLKLFSKHMKNGGIIINKTDGILVNKSLINNRKDFDFKVPDYEEMVIQIKEWILNHKNLYPAYEVLK